MTSRMILYSMLGCLMAGVCAHALPAKVVDMAAPMSVSVRQQDLKRAAPGAVPLQVNLADAGDLWQADEVFFRGMPLPNGHQATLKLRPISSPVDATWLVSGGSTTHVPAPAVLLLAGEVDGVPDSGVFLGIDGDRVQGWIETTSGLHLISTPPEGGPTLMFKVGAGRGSIDLSPSTAMNAHIQQGHTGLESLAADSEYGRILVELTKPESELRSRLTDAQIRRLPKIIHKALQGSDEDEEYGACCILPGFCAQLTASQCADFCSDEEPTPGETDTVYCNRTWNGPPVDFTPGEENLPPCWLGPGIPCDERWICYESVDQEDVDAGAPEDALGNWTGACCIGGQVVDKIACECALEGGQFLIVPTICFGEDLAAPELLSASQFVDAETIEDIDPDMCNKPKGACCIEQQILCGDITDPDNPIYDSFKGVTCIVVPESVCNDGNIIRDSFLGTGQPGTYTKDCFPCLFDPTTGDQICPSSMQKASGGTASPISLQCQSIRMSVDTDEWYLERFAGDVGAAQSYAITLLASINWILERDALVSFEVGDLIIRGNPALGETPAYYVAGACCFSSAGYCLENYMEQDCTLFGGDWLGPGTSCWNESGGQPNQTLQCSGNDSDIYENDDSFWSITNTLGQMTTLWENAAEGGPLGRIRDSSSLVLLLSGYPYVRSAFNNEVSEYGIEWQDVTAGVQGVICQGADPYAVAAVRGGFPWPGDSFASDDVNWDMVTSMRAVGLAIGVNETSSYGYDNCFGPRCEGASAIADCDHLFFYSDLTELNDPWISNSQMPSTLMSFCHMCPGGTANQQLRFRSEIAARIYTRFANFNCEIGTSPDSGDCFLAPYAANDVVYSTDGLVPTINVLANDIAPGCADQNEFDPATFDPATFDPQSDPWPPFALSIYTLDDDLSDNSDDVQTSCNPDCVDVPTTNAPDPLPVGDPIATIGGGEASIVQDAFGVDRIEYVPPADPCGVDFFYYWIETEAPFIDVDPTNPDNDNPLWCDTISVEPGLVRILNNPCESPVDINCVLPNCPQSAVEPQVPPQVPLPGADDVIVIDQTSSGPETSLTWTGLTLQLSDPAVTSPQDAFLRVWMASEAGGQADTFFEVYPFGSDAESCPPILATQIGADTWMSDGTCTPPGNLFVPGDGLVLVQCLEEQDGIPGPDAWWIEGEFCLKVQANTGVGACCVDGLCLDTTPYDCAAFGWSWGWWDANGADPEGWRWEYDPGRAGYFHGIGTACEDRDWCRRTAPCCFQRPDDTPGCALLTCEECDAIGGLMISVNGNDVDLLGTEYCGANQDGHVWAGPGEPPTPFWDSPCGYPVCNFDLLASPPLPLDPPDASSTFGACCILTDVGTQFCADLTRSQCELARTSFPFVVSASWSIRGLCDVVPCNASLGSCCLSSNGAWDCVDDVTAAECDSYWINPPDPSSPPDQIFFNQGIACAADPCDSSGATGACCLRDFDSCCEGFTREVCQALYGTWLGDGSDCTDCVNPSQQSGVCSLGDELVPMCTEDLSETDCVSLGGTWYASIENCNQGMPDHGMGIGPLNQPALPWDPSGEGNTVGACCYEYECVSSVARFDCILAGGIPIPKKSNPFHPGCEGPPAGPLYGACCYDNARYGRVCINDTRVSCERRSGGVWCSQGRCGLTPPTCETCDPLDLCAPGECEITVSFPSGQAQYKEVFIAPDESRCADRDGVWLGYRRDRAHGSGPLDAEDLNRDGRIDVSDVIDLISRWGDPGGPADLDGNGSVDVMDLQLLLSAW